MSLVQQTARLLVRGARDAAPTAFRATKNQRQRLWTAFQRVVPRVLSHTSVGFSQPVSTGRPPLDPLRELANKLSDPSKQVSGRAEMAFIKLANNGKKTDCITALLGDLRDTKASDSVGARQDKVKLLYNLCSVKEAIPSKLLGEALTVICESGDQQTAENATSYFSLLGDLEDADFFPLAESVLTGGDRGRLNCNFIDHSVNRNTSPAFNAEVLVPSFLNGSINVSRSAFYALSQKSKEELRQCLCEGGEVREDVVEKLLDSFSIYGTSEVMEIVRKVNCYSFLSRALVHDSPLTRVAALEVLSAEL